MFLDDKKPGEASVQLEPWRRILLDAASLLETDGWCQHRTRNDRGQYCILGAIQIGILKEIRTDFESLIGYKKAEEVLHSIVGPVPEWNDQPGRTREEVCAVLRQAAAL